MLCTHNAHAAIPPQKNPPNQMLHLNQFHPSNIFLLLAASSTPFFFLFLNTSTLLLLNFFFFLFHIPLPPLSGGLCILKWKKNHQKCKRGFEEDGWVEF
jgi:predicted membrane channel-forming protein YqfA (hemolysin III family)